MLRLKNILSFTGLVANVPVSMAHGLNWMGRAVPPDLVALDQSGYTVIADATNVTVTRLTGPAAVNAYCESWHSIERAFGAKQIVALSPRPIIIQGDGSGSAASTSQIFRYVANGTETDTIAIGVAQGFVVRANPNYNVQGTMGKNSTGIQIQAIDPATFTVNGFTLKLTAAPALNDSIMFTVEDLT